MRRAERALTLLEVMAAVAILGIVYTYLARAATQGVLSEGESRQRMEASLAADAALAEIESQLAAGVPLERGISEVSGPRFDVTIEVTALEPSPELLEVVPDFGPGVPSLFGDGTPRDPGLLLQVLVRITWFDGVRERSIERVTFGFDAAAGAALLGGPGAS